MLRLKMEQLLAAKRFPKDADNLRFNFHFGFKHMLLISILLFQLTLAHSNKQTRGRTLLSNIVFVT